MTAAIAILLALLTFAFIIYPLLKKGERSADSVQDEELQELYSRRDTAYSMLKELEFDFQSGILTGEDYRALEKKYKGKAISILRDIDSVEKGTNVEETIEKQVLKLRQSKGKFCPQCGTECQETDRFCSQCGTTLSKGEGVD